MVQHNSYPLKDWHFEHMQKTIVKYVSGISDDATYFQKKMHRKYNGKIGYVRRNIDFDIKHGVTRDEVVAFLNKIQNDSSFSDIRKSEGSRERIRELQIEKK
jgi:ABC-type Mn2+/Zn2+ transport system ATPase subunit